MRSPSRLAGWIIRAIGLLLILVRGAVPAGAAQAPAGPAPLKVFLDCPRCDDVYIRQHVGFIEYVRDRMVADVHVLVTTEPTGGGGLRWRVQFIGLRRRLGQNRNWTFTTEQDATPDDQRRAFERTFKIGLLAYLPDGAVPPDLNVTWTAPAQATAPHDPWNYWVFRISGNGFGNGEASSRSLSSFVSLSASRTTDAWKIQIASDANLRQNTFDIDDEHIDSRTHAWGVNALVVKSLGPNWSFGATAAATHSSFSNIDQALTAAPGIEFNVFPYQESSHRSLTLQYTVGMVHNQYESLTVYGRMEDQFPRHTMRTALALRQPWGSLNVVSNFSQQLDALDFYRETVYGEADVRLFKGFSFNVYTQYEKIADLIALRNDSASETEVLLRTQQLRTSYGYFISFGVSYSFGSVFNTIVNPRFTF